MLHPLTYSSDILFDVVCWIWRESYRFVVPASATWGKIVPTSDGRVSSYACAILLLASSHQYGSGALDPCLKNCEGLRSVKEDCASSSSHAMVGGSRTSSSWRDMGGRVLWSLLPRDGNFISK
uniref:Uncharacterized protein n=1 Tax=Odontella aurita TaxID=265563 RepID=A0A7S4MWU9_9STRA|mmetsp:Transcript_37481/g.112402  ORF Transcript_37481/g.112402 Transcript_37481/m.112402 type:complete len:123 (+) Transcript_37481:2891-3259(+)